MVVFASELVHMWTCRVQHMRLLYSGCKPKQTGNPFISSHVRLLPLLLTALFTEMTTFTLLALYLQTTMNKSMVMWTMNMVIFLNFWLMMILWKYANLEYAEHVKSCHFHQHSSHGRNDNCSLCSRHQQLLSSHLFTRTHESTITVVLSLLRKTLKCIQILFLVFLILLAGDVEINPGPGMTIVTDKDVVFLMDHLAQHSFKWEVIGTALHFLPSELENIRHSPQVITPQQRLNAVLCQWVQWPTTAHSQTPTVEILCDALRSDLVGLGAVANKLYDARNYFSSQLSLCLPDTLTAGHETRLEDAEEPRFYADSANIILENPPQEGTPEYNELHEHCSQVEIILHTVNDNEYLAALTYMKSPSEERKSNGVQNFPNVGMVVGVFANKKVVLILTDPGESCEEMVKETISCFPSAQYILAVGVCYGFDQKKHLLGDVLVSKRISNFKNYKAKADGTIENRGETKCVADFLSKVFCKRCTFSPPFKVTDSRYAKVYAGTFLSRPVLMDNKSERDKFHAAAPTAIGGEMEGGVLMKLEKQEPTINGIIIIKGVVDYGDGTKNKDWQFITAMAAVRYTETKLKSVNIPQRSNHISDEAIALEDKGSDHISYEVIALEDEGSDHISDEVLALEDEERDTLNLERYYTYKKALAEGDTVPMQYLKCYLVGIPQIGKTTVMKRLTDEIRNLSSIGGKPYWPSTGVAECAYVQVKQTTITNVKSQDRSEWSMTISKDELQEAIELYCNTDKFQPSNVNNDNSNVNDPVEALSSPNETQSTVPQEVDSGEASGAVSQTVVPQADSHEVKSKVTDTIPADIRDIMELFDSKLKEAGNKILTSKEVQMLLMIDVGGQSSFLEMLPLLMKGPSMYLTFFKLSENPLEDSYFDKYAKDSNCIIDKEKRAEHTVGDAIIQILSGVESSRRPNEDVRKVIEETIRIEDASTPYNNGMYRTIAFLIGTHKDLIKESHWFFRYFLSFFGYNNSIDTKLVEIDNSFEKHIEEVFGSGENIVAWAECKTAASRGKLIFAMDNMNGNEKEIQELRSRLMDEAKKIGNFRIPVRWLLFGIVLRKEYEWITMDDCIILAQRFHIPEEEVDSILWFLSSVTGMLLYQPDIKYEPLQKVIFCNPQIIFDNVSELIILNVYDTSGDKSWIKCLEERGKFFPIKLECRTHMRDNFIPFDDLQQSVRRKHDQDHVNQKVLMPIEALVQFLMDRKIVAPCPLPKGQEGDIPYIMPATLDYGSVDHLVCQDDAAAPCSLFMKFTKTYYVPPGLFSCLITTIFNEYSNCDEDCIKEVKRNYISFYDQARIVLISSSKWLEVRVLHYNSSLLNTKRQACFHVMKIVSGMVSKVMEDLNFSNEYDYFIKCGPDHYVPIKSDVSCKDGQHYVYCKVKGNITISQAQQCWFSSKLQDATPDTTSHKREKEITHEKLNLMKWRKNGEKKTCRLKEGMSEKWREIGQNVGISDAILGGYWTSYHDNQECINSVITEWIRKTSVEYPSTWTGLKKLLTSVSLIKLANEIEEALLDEGSTLNE